MVKKTRKLHAPNMLTRGFLEGTDELGHALEDLERRYESILGKGRTNVQNSPRLASLLLFA